MLTLYVWRPSWIFENINSTNKYFKYLLNDGYYKIFSTKNISIACSPRLYDLFSRSFPKINFIPVARPRYIEKIDLRNYSNVPGSDIMSVVDNNAVKAIQSCDRVLFTTDLLHRCLPDYDSFPRK